MMSLLLESAIRSLVLGVAIWLGLKALRVKSPAVKSVVWTVTLIASLAMPALVAGMQQAASPVPAAALPYVPAPVLQAFGPVAIPPVVATPAPALHWAGLLPYGYGTVASVLLIRLLAGLALTWRLMRAAKPLGGDAAVRLSANVTVPVTFAGTILLPADASGWGAAKREAVLAHERAHIARGDFAVHLLAKLNRAVFWFNPFAWWLDRELAELAEAASDDIAVAEVGGPLSYAEILLDVANGAGRVPAGVAMARSGMVAQRIERIIGGIRFPRMGGWATAAIVVALLPLVLAAAITIAAPADEKAAPIDPKAIDRYVGSYEFDPTKGSNQILNVTRAGDRLFVDAGSDTAKMELFQKADGTFIEKGTDTEIDFTSNGAGAAPSLFLVMYGKKPGSEAKRVDAAEAARVAASVTQKLQEQSRPHKEVSVDPAIFDAYVGHYKFDRLLFDVTREGSYLFTQVVGQPKLRLVPESDHDFFYREVDAQISFPAGPKASQLTLHQNGRDIIAKRIDDAEFKTAEAEFDKRIAGHNKTHTAVAIDPKLLDLYTGRFQAAPNAVFVVTREGDSLMVKFKEQPAIQVFPENDHTFFYTVVPAQITFITSDGGRATGLVLHQSGLDIPASRVE